MIKKSTTRHEPSSQAREDKHPVSKGYGVLCTTRA